MKTWKNRILMLKKCIPLFIFLFFNLLLIGTTIFYAPSWGLWDAGLLVETSHIWASNNVMENIGNVINHNIYYMPFSVVYGLLTYHIFRNYPLLCYILVILQNMVGIFLWGLVLHKVFAGKKREFLLNTFLFPLTLFLFTPFWNIFNYVSLQEKFILLFSAISIYFIKRYSDAGKIKYLLISLLFTILTVLSKPQGVYIVLVYIAYSCVLAITKDRRRLVAPMLITHICLLVSYSLITIGYRGNGYASGYNLSLTGIANNFMNTPLVIKLLFVIEAFMVFYIIFKVKKQNRFSLEAVFIPLGFLCYIAVLLPWGIIPYHISVTAPYAMGMFFPAYSYFNKKSRLARIAVNCLILFLVLFTFLYIIKPRISRVADVKKTVIFLKDFSAAQVGRYFFPPPFAESAFSMSVFSGLPIKYIDNGILSANMLGDDVGNFIIFDNQDPSIELAGVDIEKEIYRNDNWIIYRVKKSENIKKKFTVIFKENFIDRIKTYLKTKK
jgi:hypothetical protein